MKGHPRPEGAEVSWEKVEDLCEKDDVRPYGPMKTVKKPA